MPKFKEKKIEEIREKKNKVLNREIRFIDEKTKEEFEKTLNKLLNKGFKLMSWNADSGSDTPVWQAILARVLNEKIEYDEYVEFCSDDKGSSIKLVTADGQVVSHYKKQLMESFALEKEGIKQNKTKNGKTHYTLEDYENKEDEQLYVDLETDKIMTEAELKEFEKKKIKEWKLNKKKVV